MISKFLQHFDMFPSVPTFRIKSESQFTSLCGGTFSLFLLMFFTYIFVIDLIQIIKLRKIESMEVNEMNRPDNQTIINQTVAIGLFGAPIVKLQAFFTVIAFMQNPYGIGHYIQLRPCLREDWPLITDQQFESFQLIDCYCPINKDELNNTGYFSSDFFTTISFHIYQCNNATTGGRCAPQQAIKSLFQTEFNYLVGKFLIMNAAFNPNQQDPVDYYVNENLIWIPLEYQFSTKIFILHATWEVKTDVSFWPYVKEEVRTGYFVDEYKLFNINGGDVPNVLDVFILNSRRHKTILREYGKFDDLLSYVGGLFGILISCIAFFVMSYNEYRYELWISESSFTSGKGKNIREKDFNFFLYITYSIYDWVKLITCCEPNWEQCQAIDKTRQEAVEQIEVKYLLRRISYLQNMMKTMLKREDQTAFHLIEPQSIENIKKERKFSNYYNIISEDHQLPTIASSRITDQVFHFAKDINPKSHTECSFEQHHQNEENIFAIDQSLTSLQLMDKYLDSNQEWRKEVELKPEEQEIEKMISDDFYSMNEDIRMNIIENIPLLILHRIRMRRSEISQTSPGSLKENSFQAENSGINVKSSKFSFSSIINYPPPSKPTKDIKLTKKKDRERSRFSFFTGIYSQKDKT